MLCFAFKTYRGCSGHSNSMLLVQAICHFCAVWGSWGGGGSPEQLKLTRGNLGQFRTVSGSLGQQERRRVARAIEIDAGNFCATQNVRAGRPVSSRVRLRRIAFHRRKKSRCFSFITRGWWLRLGHPRWHLRFDSASFCAARLFTHVPMTFCRMYEASCMIVHAASSFMIDT